MIQENKLSKVSKTELPKVAEAKLSKFVKGKLPKVIETELSKIVKGRRCFSSEEAFAKYMKQTVNADLQKIEEQNIKDGFLSFYELVHQTRKEYKINKSSLNNDVNLIIEDPFLSHVLNYNLEVQVGTRIFRVEKEYSYSYEVGFFKAVEKFKVAQNEYELSDDKLIEINKYLSVSNQSIVLPQKKKQPMKSMKSRGVWAFGYGWKTNPGWKGFGHEKVMKGLQWYTRLFFYTSAGLKVEYQEKRGWWIFKSWQNVKAERLELKWNGVMNVEYKFGSNQQTNPGGPAINNIITTTVANSRSANHRAILEYALIHQVIFSNKPRNMDTIKNIDFEPLNSTHRCKKFGVTKEVKHTWIW